MVIETTKDLRYKQILTFFMPNMCRKPTKKLIAPKKLLSVIRNERV